MKSNNLGIHSDNSDVYSVTACGGAAANGLGHPTLGTCVHQAGPWWHWIAVKCHRVWGKTTWSSCDPSVDWDGLTVCIGVHLSELSTDLSGLSP